jgi:hypothetical protein
MGIEIVEGHSGPGIVSRGLISHVVRTDRPMDGGWGYDASDMGVLGTEAPTSSEETIPFRGWRYAEAAANVAIVDRAVSSAIAETAQKVVSQGVSYAGEVPALPDRPEPGFKPFPTLP